MDLRFRSACADCTYRETICQELRGDCIQHLAGNWHPLVCQVNEELARDAQALVDVEAVVDVRVVDETFPAHSGPGFLQVGTHDDQQLILVLFLQLQ